MKKPFCLLALGACFFFLSIAPSYSQGTAEETQEDTVLKKLDELFAGQKQILAQLDEMKQELYVIKVRSTKR